MVRSKIEFKIAGMLVLVGAVLLQIIDLRWPANKCRRVFHSISVFFYDLFFARITYYKIFNSADWKKE